MVCEMRKAGVLSILFMVVLLVVAIIAEAQQPKALHRDGTDRGDGGEADHPLGVVAHADGDAIAGLHAVAIDEQGGRASTWRITSVKVQRSSS